ncbi:MAG: hypothetical protein HS129_13370 [Leptospiraceae bacterium]|nr:hypothetical protein [Leptospiraceae bacterium]
MNKNLISIAAIALALGLFVNCAKKKEDDNNSALMFYLLDQTSGKCATITKSATGTTTYSATGSAIPKGGCNAATLNTSLYTTSPSEAKTAVDTGFDGLKTVYDATTGCSTLSSAITLSKTNTTTATITTAQSSLTSGNQGCSMAGYRIVSGKSSAVMICKDDASITAVKALTNYSGVGSVSTDMSVSLADLKAYQTTAMSVTGFTAAAIALLKPYGQTEMTTLSATNYLAFMNAAFSVPACASAIVASDSALKSVLTSMSGGSYSTYGISKTDAASVSAVVTASLKCGYGAGFTATTSSSFGTASGTCPTTYPTF